MNNERTKSANRKALPKFLLIVVIASIIGGLCGYLISKYGLYGMSEVLNAVQKYFGSHIAPYIMLAIAIIIPVIAIPTLAKAKKEFSAWDGEDEDVYASFDSRLSKLICLTSSALIVSYFLIAATYSGFFILLEDDKLSFMALVTLIAFIAIMVEAIIIQQKCVDAVKVTNPEKDGSVYESKFHKKWFDSCDEAEKLIIGKCAYKAYIATNKACAILAPVLAVCALVFDIGFIPSLCVCVLWIVNLVSYYKEAVKMSKKGNRIS